MTATTFPSKSSPLAVRRLRDFCGTGLLLIALLVATPAGADLGRWTPSSEGSASDWRAPTDTGRHAIHLVLLPGDSNPYHSRILWWSGEDGRGFHGGQWGWNSGGDDTCSTYPGSNFTDLGTISPSGVNVFCAGHAQLADGRLLVPGGTSSTTSFYGENKCVIYSPGSSSSQGSWTNPNHLMAEWRWYPTATSLRDGRTLVLSGTKGPLHRMFGGKRNGSLPSSPVGDSLYRFEPVAGGNWMASTIPDADPTSGTRPAVREGHTFVDMSGIDDFKINGLGAQIMFGGKGSNGLPLNDTWFLTREDNVSGSDYHYKWTKKSITGTAPPRADHSAIVAFNSMIVYGGLDATNVPLGDAQRLYKDALSGNYTWSQITASGNIPAGRFGHRAVYDKTGSVERMIVYGGRTATGQPPSDSRVWELRFSSPSTATWREMPQIVPSGAPLPLPRYDASMVLDATTRTHSSGRQGHVAFVYGGNLGGEVYSDTLWALWIFPDSVSWERKVYGGSYLPGPRARHSATWDPLQPIDPPPSHGRMYIFGGETASGPADQYAYALDPWTSWSQSWMRWADAGFSLSGHAAVKDRNDDPASARLAEVYTPSSGWQAMTATKLFQPTYPITFLVPGGAGKSRIVTFGADSYDYWVDIPATGLAGAWNQHKYPDFGPYTGVMYRPGKIMLGAGRYQTSTLVGTTKTLDVTNLGSNWVTSGSMVPRHFHNLVLTPDGKVTAIGGLQTLSENDPGAVPVRRPQIWDPDANGVGAWSDTILAGQPRKRGYHSTAILLPDGRILSAGGQHEPDRYLAEIFCPPYLFDGNGNRATRPSITGAPDTVTYGDRFAICTGEPGTIASACLIRPGATTHGFDENQRYVPLTIDSQYGQQVTVVAPPGPDEAPPGYYMLFVLKNGVPSVARWVRIGSSPTLDDCDNIAPTSVSDLTIMDYGQTFVDLSWTAPGDDALSSTANEYDLRYSTIPITESNFYTRTTVPGEPTPGPPGTIHSCITVANLSPCTYYYFALKTGDDRPLWSTISNVPGVKTLCTGGGPVCDGGGMFAQGWGGGGWAPENSLFWDAGGSQVSEGYLLKGSAGPVDGEHRMRLLKLGTGRADINQVSLATVDHDPALGAFGSSGQVLLGTTAAVQGVTDAAGVDVSSAVSGASDQPYSGQAGQVLFVTLGASTSPHTGLVVESAGYTPSVAGDSTGILVQAPRADGTWQTLAQIHPRRTFDRYAVDAAGNATLRLVFLRDHLIRSLCRLNVAGTPTPPDLALSRAVHSRLGDVSGAVQTSGGSSTTLGSGDALELGFTPTPVPAGKVRELFLQVRGAYATRPSARAEDVVLAGSDEKFDFALGPARPNPSSGSIAFNFTMARQGAVTIRVYDVAGRLVRTLVNGSAEAGPHEFVWNATDDGGRHVGAGVYFYRMTAGSWVSQRKVVFLEK